MSHKHLKNMLLISSLLVAVMLTSGCFEYREEIWLNNDLSGTISIDLAIGELYIDYATEVGLEGDIFTAEGLEEIVEGIVGVTLINADMYTADDNRTIKLSLKFDDVDALKRIYSAIEGIDFLGEIKLEDASRGQLTFSRTVSLTDPRVKTIAGFDDKLNSRFWVTKIHFPTMVNESNAPEGNIDERTRQIVIWGYSIDVLTKSDRIMEATFSKPGGFTVGPMTVAVVVFIAVIALLYRFAMPKRKKQIAKPVEKPSE